MKITSMFLSVNGECCLAGQGSWTVFVRTFGCSARCSYCDTKYSYDGSVEYQELSPREVFAEIIKLDPGCNRVTLTGGEPLEQDMKELIELIRLLKRMNYEISVETNGMQMEKIQQLVKEFYVLRSNDDLSFITDFKLPSSGKPWVNNKAKSRSIDKYAEKFKCLNENDFVKLVVKNKNDFEVALEVIKIIKKDNYTCPRFYFSPCNISAPSVLFEWMKEADCAKQDIGFSMQIHKIIFPNNNWRDEEGQE